MRMASKKLENFPKVNEQGRGTIGMQILNEWIFQKTQVNSLKLYHHFGFQHSLKVVHTCLPSKGEGWKIV